jgi:hypothetical protein
MIYIKPNGIEIEINENSVPYAKELGWKPKPKAKPKPKPKPKPKKKD